MNLLSSLVILGLIICLIPQRITATEGVDYTTGGDWNTAITEKPWSIDGGNTYGTSGYHFFNVTTPEGRGQPYRPADENLQSRLPKYIKSILPSEDSYTAHSFGYLNIDAPWQSDFEKLESGLLALHPDSENSPQPIVNIELGEIKNIYGFRIGILTANGDREEITPTDIVISNNETKWSRSVVNLPPSTDGMWVFFNIAAEHSNQTLTLSVRTNPDSPVAIGGLVFENLTVAPPEQPLNVTSEQAVSQFGNVVWDAFPARTNLVKELETWEQKLATQFSEVFIQNKKRLEEIQYKLSQTPTPYTGETTGTGGYLSHWVGSGKNEVEIHFHWDSPVTIDAVALFPLRLFLADEDGLTENAYWPGSINLSAYVEGKIVEVSEISSNKSAINESLPELASFEAVTTKHAIFKLTGLARKLGRYQFAAGFSEICIFSGMENVAPRARIRANMSREGYRVFSKEYLTDGQTPLGLPEIGPRKSGSLGLSLRGTRFTTPNKPINIRLNFEEDVTVDAIRIDPAVIYKPGQAFPVRFTVDLLDAEDSIIHSDVRHQDDKLILIGLNPYISYFPETQIRSIRLRIYEVSKPTARARPWIQISEITPIFKGEHIRENATIVVPKNLSNKGTSQLFDPSGLRLFWRNDFVYDGQTQAGLALPLREWTEGLFQRKKLLEEQNSLLKQQENIKLTVRNRTIWGICLFIVLVVLVSLYLILYSRVTHRRKLRAARERIASDLHDDVGSNLGTITLHTELLKNQLDAPNHLEHLEAITKLTRESVYGLREVLHTTAPRIGRAQDILEYIEEMAHLVLRGIDVKLDLDHSANGVLKSPERRKGILLYYKEAITNIQSHSQCNEVTIVLKRHNRHLELKIEDNGVGMSASKLSKNNTLRTLKLRANEMNASLNISSTVGKGTRLELSIPLRAASVKGSRTVT